MVENICQTNIASIMEYLNDSLRKVALNETEWLIKKNGFEIKISDLEAQVKAHENINIDFMRKIKMLEYALSQERSKINRSGLLMNNVEIKMNNLIEIEDKRELLIEEDVKRL